MTNEDQVLGIEKTLRAVPIKSDMQYKPNIYTQLGIYRNNKYKLRPTIYSSVKDSSEEGNGYKIERVVDANWSYSVNDDSQTSHNVTAQDLQASLNKLQLAIGQVNEAIAKMELKQEIKRDDDSKGKPGKKENEKVKSSEDGEHNAKNEEKIEKSVENLKPIASGAEKLSNSDGGKVKTEVKGGVTSAGDEVEDKSLAKKDIDEEKADKKATSGDEKEAGNTIEGESVVDVPTEKKTEEGKVAQGLTEAPIVSPETKDVSDQVGKGSGEGK